MNKEDAEKFRALCALRTENALLRKENEELKLDKKTDESSLHLLRRELAIATKETAELKERWRKTHDASELRVQLARAREEIAELKRRAFDNEEYSKQLSQRITCESGNDAPYLKL